MADLIRALVPSVRVTSGRRTVTLNLQTMTVVEEDDDNDNS